MDEIKQFRYFQESTWGGLIQRRSVCFLVMSVLPVSKWRHSSLMTSCRKFISMVPQFLRLIPGVTCDMGVARIFQRGGHTDSYIGYSPNCHLNIVGCLLTKRLTKGGSRAPQDRPPLATPLTCDLLPRGVSIKPSVSNVKLVRRLIYSLDITPVLLS